MLVNGTLNPQVNLPAQIVRLRILDAEIARNHNLGFSDNRTFYVIGTDGGLLNAPVPVTRHGDGRGGALRDPGGSAGPRRRGPHSI